MDNEITFLHPAVTRKLYPLPPQINAEDEDRENVRSGVYWYIRNFVINNYKFNYSEDHISLINKLNVPSDIKNLMAFFCQNSEPHHQLCLTYQEVLIPVLHYILSSPARHEMERIATVLIRLSVSTNQKLTHLIGIISGVRQYGENESSKPSDNEVLAQLVLNIRNVMIANNNGDTNINYEVLSDGIYRELSRFNYPAKVIDEWIQVMMN
jgi:hypothetical protein